VRVTAQVQALSVLQLWALRQLQAELSVPDQMATPH
jgi:hypothetical protein